MESIAKLYEDVMAGVEKTAADTSADGGPEFDANFFEKVAEGDEESTTALNDFIDESRAAGHSDEEIEEAVDEAMQATGAEGGSAIGEPDDEYEEAKLSAYNGGAEQALADVLESDMAKEAGVSADDLVDYELGMNFGAGYADARGALDEAIQKIAAKGKKGKKLYERLVEKMAPKGSNVPKSLHIPKGLNMSEAEMALNVSQGEAQRIARRRAKGVVGAAAGTAAAGGLGAAYLAGRKKKDNKK